MTNIIIYGNCKNNILEKLILNELSNRYSIFFYKKGIYLNKGSGYELLVISADELVEINVPQSIIILQSDAKLGKNIIVPKDTVAIADSQNTDGLQGLCSLKIPAVSCGLSARDSVTFSSRTSDSAVIALQRSITALSGKLIEPLEFPINFNEISDEDISQYDYEILAYTALRLLLDDFKSSIGILI